MAIFERRIEVGVEDEGTDLRVTGRLRDTRLGEELHGMDVEMLVSAYEGEIKEIHGEMPWLPMEECAAGLEALREVLGMKIRPGFTDAVKGTVGSVRGCTHLAALVMTMANTTVQGMGAFLRKNLDKEGHDELIAKHAEQLGLLDSCVCWAEDGPIIRRWREEQERKARGG